MLTSNQDRASLVEPLPALPPKAQRRRSVRASYSWCFRRPPSRRRVAVATARGLPELVVRPAIQTLPEARQ
jgi:hypothetical protein